MIDTKNRKDDHIKYASQQFNKNMSTFTDIKFVHNSIGRVNMDDIDTSIKFLGRTFARPYYVNAMTGGSKDSTEINRRLAILARETGLALASGSASAALRDPSLAKSFTVIRDENPDGFVLANIGAERSVEDAKRAIDLLQADALQVHLNVPEELIMPEGDREFKGYRDSIHALLSEIEIPIIVKEVGFGMSRENIQELIELGAKNIDVSGAGGTNFIDIENARREEKEFDYMSSFGQSTTISLLEAQEFVDKVSIIASGGVKTPLDVLKAVSLGATSAAMSAYFLNQVKENEMDVAIKNVHRFDNELKTIMCILNAETVSDLRDADIIISGQAREWAEIRNIDIKSLANRRRNNL